MNIKTFLRHKRYSGPEEYRVISSGSGYSSDRSASTLETCRRKTQLYEKNKTGGERVYRVDGVIMSAQASLMKLEESRKQETTTRKD